MKKKNQAVQVSEIFAKILNRCRGRLWLRDYAETLEIRLKEVLGDEVLPQAEVFRIAFGNRIENFFPSSANPKKCVIARLNDLCSRLPDWDDEESDRMVDMIEELEMMPELPEHFRFELGWTDVPMTTEWVDCREFLAEAVERRPDLPQRAYFESLLGKTELNPHPRNP